MYCRSDHEKNQVMLPIKSFEVGQWHYVNIVKSTSSWCSSCSCFKQSSTQNGYPLLYSNYTILEWLGELQLDCIWCDTLPIDVKWRIEEQLSTGYWSPLYPIFSNTSLCFFSLPCLSFSTLPVLPLWLMYLRTATNDPWRLWELRASNYTNTNTVWIREYQIYLCNSINIFDCNFSPWSYCVNVS